MKPQDLACPCCFIENVPLFDLRDTDVGGLVSFGHIWASGCSSIYVLSSAELYWQLRD